MTNDYKLSIIIPVYKVEKYLDRCIESVINQTYKNLEIILVDDGSPDKCPELCDKWAEMDDRIIVIHKKNGGLSSARNAGLDACSGDVIAFLDSDDYIYESMYEEMLSLMKNSCSDIVCCGRYIKSRDIEIPLLTAEKNSIFTNIEAVHQLLVKDKLDEASWDKLYLADIFKNRRFPEGEVNEDILLIIQILGESKKVAHIGKPFYYYWKNQEGITKSSYDSLHVVVDHMEKVEDLIMGSYPMLENSLKVFLARYAVDMMENMNGSYKARKKYPQDYKFYYRKLFENYFALLFTSNSYITIKFKIKGLFLLLGLYMPMKKVYKKFFK